MGRIGDISKGLKIRGVESAAVFAPPAPSAIKVLLLLLLLKSSQSSYLGISALLTHPLTQEVPMPAGVSLSTRHS